MSLLPALPDTIHAADPDAASSLVSYQYVDSTAETPLQPNIVSPLVSYQFHDWPGDDNLTFKSSLNVSYFFNGPPQILTQPVSQLAKVGSNVTLTVSVEGTQPLSYQWRINGVAITNAKNATLSFSNIQQQNSGTYSVVVTNSSGSAVSNDANVVVFSAPATAKPTPPSLVRATQSLSINQTTPPRVPSISQLKVMGSGGAIDPNKMTIVLTHGWSSNSTDWPASMAASLAVLYANKANILAWDWDADARLELAASAARTSRQGEALGSALMNSLGPAYDKPIHFLGHSLGTIVNCRAADYIHGDWRPRGETRPTSQKYSAANTHMTLFDQAELVKAVQGLYLVMDIVLAAFSEQSSRDGAQHVASILWSKVIPEQFAWVDNYISEVGFLDSDAANVMLWRGTAHRNPVAAHGYAAYWYQQTISTPLGSQMGHRWSFERNTIGSAPDIDTYFLQNLDPETSELQVSQISDLAAEALRGSHIAAYPELQAIKGLSAIASRVQAEVNARGMNVIQYAGNMTTSIVESFSAPTGAPIYSGTAASTPVLFLNADQTASNSAQARWDLQFNIQPGAPQAQQFNSTRSVNTSGVASSSGSIYTIIPVHVPVEAVGMSFEYSIAGAAVDDFMTMGIGSSNEFTMESRFLDDGAWNRTPVIPVSKHRDQDIQLVFALNGVNGAPVGTLGVRNIQFYIPPKPQLSLALDSIGTTLTISWPLSAVDWTLESTMNLADPNGWKPEIAPPEEGEFSRYMTFDVSGAKRVFFRLRK